MPLDAITVSALCAELKDRHKDGRMVEIDKEGFGAGG